MKRFIEGDAREQGVLFPDHLEDFVGEDNPVRAVDAFVDVLDLVGIGFNDAAATGRPGYHPAVLLKIYVYGYLNRIQSSRRLELETGRNVEMMWLTGRLAPDFKTIADFRRDNCKAIRKVCSQFVMLCRQIGLLNGDGVAIDGSKFKAVNNRDKNFTPAKVKRRLSDIETSIERYLSKLDAADRNEPALPPAKVAHLQERIIKLKEQMQELKAIEIKVQNAPDAQVSLTGQTLTKGAHRSDRQSDINFYRHLSACSNCHLKPRCTTEKLRRIRRWEQEDVLDDIERRLEEKPDAMRIRRSTVEHPFGTLKAWMGYTHFLTQTREKVAAEMSLHVLAYNFKRVLKIIGIAPLMAALRG